MQFCLSPETSQEAAVRLIRQKGVEPKFRFSAKLTKIAGKRSLIICHDETGYCCIFHKVAKRELKDLGSLIFTGIESSLKELGIAGKLLDAFFEEAGEQVFTSIKGATYSNRLERVEAGLNERTELLDTRSCYQSLLTNIINSTAVIIKRADGKQYPSTVMTRFLIESYGHLLEAPLFAYTLFIQSDQRYLDDWRKVIVPPMITFRQLHYMMQLLYDHDNDHLFEFLVPDLFGYQRIQPAETEDDAISIFFEEDEPDSYDDKKTSLKEMMGTYEDLTIFYRYDFMADHVYRLRIQRIPVQTVPESPTMLFGFMQRLPGFIDPYDLSQNEAFMQFLELMGGDDEDEDIDEDDCEEPEDDEDESEEESRIYNLEELFDEEEDVEYRVISTFEMNFDLKRVMNKRCLIGFFDRF